VPVGKSVYERYGGFASISRVVLDFYDRMLDHDDLGPYFEDIDIARIVDHQTKFVSMLLGGPASFGDEHIRAVHRRLGISPGDFEAMATLLDQTLSDHGLARDDVDHVVGEFRRRRELVVREA
jgi:hemoglobin